MLETYEIAFPAIFDETELLDWDFDDTWEPELPALRADMVD